MPNAERKLKLGDIKVWALVNGFTESSPSVLVAPYATVSVRIELLKRNLRVAIFGDGQERILTSAPPGGMHIDEYGMLQGAGLFTWFYMSYRDAETENPGSGILPVWFSKYHKEIAADHAEKARSKEPVAL
jgi:hypothetical protein